MIKEGYWIRVDNREKSKHIVVISDSLENALTKAEKLYPNSILHFRNRILEVIV